MNDKPKYELNTALAERVLQVVGKGLSRGLGKPVPGQMCVEAAVCYAMGLPHSDKPTCVGSRVRAFKIALNDKQWSSNAARARGLRRLAIAQLGSDQIDQKEFSELLRAATIKTIVPIALRATAERVPKLATELEAAAKACENDPDRTNAIVAKNIADAAALGASDASDAAADAAFAAADAAFAADADAVFAAFAAADAAAYAAATALGAFAAADAADAAAYAGRRDEILALMAEEAVQILIKLKSPGCQYLYLTESGAD